MIDTLTAFDRLERDWRALEVLDPEGTVFLSWAWLRQAFAANPDRWRVLGVKASGNYVGFFPLKYRVHWSRANNELHSEIEAGGRLLWSEYTGFLCDPAHEAQTIALIAHTLQGMPWSRLSLRYEASMRRARRFADAFGTDLFDVQWPEYRINRGETDNLLCPQVSLPQEFETYMQESLSRNTRQKLRRLMRNHLDTGEVEITNAGSDDFEDALHHLLEFWVSKWVPSKGAATAQKVAANYAQILRAAQSLGLLYMPILWRGETPLGVLGHILDPQMRRVHFIVAGRSEDADAPYVGHLLHAHSIRWAIENGYEIYDFCHGNEAYKYSFGATDNRVNYLTIRPRDTAALDQSFDPICNAEALRRALQYVEAGQNGRARTICARLADLLG
ncbi:GNAT family N-acetyltransferase [Roseovarius pelagicus]|uniref:GNAT family N-acetyltransferase n=1 Tax=Roseovarius pelagicus TaxID=2980108 RepID=A0ABY6D7F6_9RHOB|nr:GNAT family N-acetyltransferase [Roseovarius pelagicus]UXX81849.1 GNAT family N-acetyltransferase [Roseovarius pelagicus]